MSCLWGQPQPDRTVWEKVAEQFRGHIMQVPSSYSAIRIDGRRAYDLARHGKKQKSPPVRQSIYDLVIEETWKLRICNLTVTCSSGTCACVGDAIWDGIMAAALRCHSRFVRSYPFCIERAHTLEEIEHDPAGVLKVRTSLFRSFPTLMTPSICGCTAGRSLRPVLPMRRLPLGTVTSVWDCVSVQGCPKPKKVFS